MLQTEVGIHGASVANLGGGGEQPGDLLGLMLAATNDGIMDWDLVSDVARYSERWKMLLGFEHHELVDAPSLWRDLTHPDDLPVVDALLRDHLENTWPFEHRWRMRHKNGGWRWSLCRAVTLRNPQGVATRCVAIFTDVTDQVLAEEHLRELTRRNELLLASAGEGFLGIDRQGVITFANPAASALLGVPVTGLVGNTFGGVVAHDCPAGRPCELVTCPILKPFRDGGIQRIPNARFGRGDGSSFAVDYVCTPAREESTVVGVVLTFRDVTEQRRAEAHLLQGQKLEAIGQLAAGIAHEINTPMQYIGDNVGFLEVSFSDLLALVQEYRSIIDELKTDPDRADLVERATAAAEAADMTFLAGTVPNSILATIEGIDRVRKIVSAMKDFSHPGGADKSLADLNRGVESTVTISANIWRQAATIETSLDPQLPLVRCDLGEINQVILNLLVNASHAISDFNKRRGEDALGVIRIETAVKEQFAEIRITDTGGGIPEAIRERIFEPFFTTKEVGRGTGQGLALVRAILVERHGGYIRFVTEPGVGTTFIVGIPLNASA